MASPVFERREDGPELTRRSRALKLWLMLKVFGAERQATAIERCMAPAEHAQQLLEADPLWRVVNPSSGSSRSRTRDGAGGDRAARVAAVAAAGDATVTSTVLQGQPALRLCTINPRITEPDIAMTLQRLADL